MKVFKLENTSRLEDWFVAKETSVSDIEMFVTSERQNEILIRILFNTEERVRGESCTIPSCEEIRATGGGSKE